MNDGLLLRGGLSRMNPVHSKENLHVRADALEVKLDALQRALHTLVAALAVLQDKVEMLTAPNE